MKRITVIALIVAGVLTIATAAVAAQKIKGRNVEYRAGGITMKGFLAALEFLKKQPTVDPDWIAAIGYCFGGGVVLNMARQGVILKGVASFHDQGRGACIQRSGRQVLHARTDRGAQERDDQPEGELQVRELPWRGTQLHEPRSHGDRQEVQDARCL
jgi:hypothetical protein